MVCSYQSQRLKNCPYIGSPEAPEALRPGHFMLPVLLYFLVCLFKSSPGNRLLLPVRKKLSSFYRISKRQALCRIKRLALANRNSIPQFVLCDDSLPVCFRFSPLLCPPLANDIFPFSMSSPPYTLFQCERPLIHLGYKQIRVVSIIIDRKHKINLFLKAKKIPAGLTDIFLPFIM